MVFSFLEYHFSSCFKKTRLEGGKIEIGKTSSGTITVKKKKKLVGVERRTCTKVVDVEVEGSRLIWERLESRPYKTW